ncbi:hypothetical protein VFPFJ_01480 [Purpureocillium lilacinum]|uniref:Arrestin-like N-terminal domain-containing protein n=1 Tax=Purpureocillium lilacinum TaxID=33203 RepID=A0A179I178_PURLI|nr:hypothetical protein VFPFJ_01480 [Purpureocillium lilacinum]OAQ95370.1 hypothetical protein VFPFJ_01480 [Purpureocillium lilacinum]PWI71421.1 hypothetical protein PCL_11515 [Purpureocillium lilacinum]GJN66421.1 hypothetical protein PLICBS_000439 [Purpureocillium lilacinum]GJN80362.1 hypothetical protein PLIIFM63780_003888 [Purpureocillium lilacinum]
MPLTHAFATKGLAIYVDNPQSSYKPGDTITGRVVRQVPVAVGADRVTITIHLTGNAAAKLVEWSDHIGESQRSYHSSFRLVNSDDTRVQLHDGPLDIPRTVEGLSIDRIDNLDKQDQTIGRSWPFSITIPRQTAAGNVQESRADITPFVPVDKSGYVPSHPLPSSSWRGREETGPGQFESGFIEYYLRATLSAAHGGSGSEAIYLIEIGT